MGPEYLDFATANLDIPFVVIGGIKRHPLEQVLSRGATTICLVTEIIGAENIGERIKEIRKMTG